jgi:hypothetical protein
LSSALIPRSIVSDPDSRALPSKSRPSATFFLFKGHWTLGDDILPSSNAKLCFTAPNYDSNTPSFVSGHTARHKLLPVTDIMGQVAFIASLFGVAA